MSKRRMIILVIVAMTFMYMIVGIVSFISIRSGVVKNNAVHRDSFYHDMNIYANVYISPNDLVDLLDSSSVFELNKTALKNKVAEDITKAFKNFVATNYKGTNQITKILIGCFITLPITCCTLNWIYPRFMELFFPNLAGIKKDNNAQEQNGGNK